MFCHVGELEICLVSKFQLCTTLGGRKNVEKPIWIFGKFDSIDSIIRSIRSIISVGDQKTAENFKRLKNREDSSDLDDNLTETTAAMKTIISKKFFGPFSPKNLAKTSRNRRRRGRWHARSAENNSCSIQCRFFH